MWAAVQFFLRSARIAAYSSRAARYPWLRRVRPLAAWAAVLPWGLTSFSGSVILTSLSILINRSYRPACGRRVLARSPLRPPSDGIHPALEVRHPLLGEFDVGLRDRSSVLLQRVQEHHQVLRALVQDTVAGVGEPDPELAQLTLYLRGDRERRGRCFWRLAVQVLRDEVIDLRGALGRQALDEP